MNSALVGGCNGPLQMGFGVLFWVCCFSFFPLQSYQEMLILLFMK